ncbi:MAG: nuclear transport factor 2 family protein [Candidatus Heimdallarchaeota archaeon]|nr:nuclear transport factor 2 family protein [Candidatus Heimdallarchaeota archaeon]
MEDIVNKHSEAYMNKDMDTFVNTCSEDIKIYDFKSGNLLMSGRDEMRKQYAATFEKSKELIVEVLEQIIHDNVIFKKLKITGHYRKDELFGVEMFEVTEGLISKKWFMS